MKILFFAPDAVRPNGEGAYAHGNLRATLLQLGHRIIDYDFRPAQKAGGADQITSEVLGLIEDERPDLFFHMHCTDELPAPLAEHLLHESGVTSVVFFSDDDWRLQDSLKVAGRYHVVITTCLGAIAEYRRHGITNVLCAPYACNPDLYYPIPGLPKRYDVSFVGQAYRGRPEMIRWLKDQGVNIRVWGQGWERQPALRDIAGGLLPHRAMLEVFSASKILLGMSWVSGDGVTLQIKGRTFEYAACRGFQLTTHDARLTAYFRENEEIAFYRNREDLLKQIRFYLDHEDERERIAQASYERVLNDHTWGRRLQRVLADIALMRRERTMRPVASERVRQDPFVSVLTYVYNGERYIDELINSVLAQTYRNFELLVLDDGSTDGTKTCVERYLNDPRVRYVYQDNIGKNLDAFHELINRSVALTTGDLICFAGADDVYLPEKLAIQVEAFRDNPALDIAFSDGYHIDAEGAALRSDFGFAESKAFTRRSLLRTLFKKNIIAHPTVMMKRTAIEEMGGFEDGYTTDPHFWLKAAPHLSFIYIDRKLIKYRIHEGGSSTSSTNRTVPETIGLLTRMRQRFTIVDLYPELTACAEKSSALYSAYVHFGNLLMTANIPVPALAVTEYAKALEHRPGGIEAVNNAAVGLWVIGAREKALPLIAVLERQTAAHPSIRHNLQLFRELQSPQPRVTDGFVLLSEPPQLSELLRALDPPHDLASDGYRGRWPIARIDSFRPPSETGAGAEPADGRPQAIVPETSAAASSAPAGSPLVSVIIPTFNRPERLAQAIQSVLAQSYPCVEIIVVNDGGRELEEVVTRYNVGRQITYIRHARNLDRAAARNTGLKVARGKYIAYLDDDDRFLPNHVQVLVEFLESHDFRVAYTDAWRVHEERQGGRYVETGRDAPYSYDFDATKLLVSNYIPVLSVMHERACLEEVGLFDESLTSHEDWDLWIRLSRVYPFAHLKEFTAEFTWRADGSTTTSRNRKDFVRTAEMVYRKHRSLSEHLPNVCAGQVQALRELRELTEGQERFTCSIIIPVWNKQELTQQCLSSLAEVTDAVDYEVIVVDNGSTDGTQHFLGQLAGDLRIIRNNENLGFAKACNQGAKAARGEFLVFLNNDTVPLKGWLSALVEEVRSHADVGVVGSKLLYEDGTIQHAGVAFSREWYVPYHIYRGVPADAPQVSRRREFKCVTAACMLVRREAFFSAGGFDEGYRNGFEDVDLCLQIGQRNWKVIYQPKSVLYHLESRTPGRKTHEKDNSRRLLDRWGHCWWLPDEDWVHLEDGYELHTMVKGDQLSYRLQPINDDHARAQRTVVADAQRAAHRQDREAVAALLRRAAEWPADVWILRWAALLCVGVGHPELAPRLWDRVLALEEDDRARVALAKCALTQNDLPGAESHLSTLLEHHPEHGEGWLLSGILAMQRHQFSAASTAFGRAIQYGADRRKAWLGIAMASVGEQRFEPAWDAASTLCREYPDDEECMHWLLRCGTALERWDPLDGYLKTFIGRNPGNLAMRFARAGVLLRRGRRDEARDEYERLRLLDATFEGLDDLALQLRDSGRQTVTGHAAC